jgi:hypothetical protein
MEQQTRLTVLNRVVDICYKVLIAGRRLYRCGQYLGKTDCICYYSLGMVRENASRHEHREGCCSSMVVSGGHAAT